MRRSVSLLLVILSCLNLPAQGQMMSREMDKAGKKLFESLGAVNKGQLQEADILPYADAYLALCVSDESRYGTWYAEAKHLKAHMAAGQGNYELAQQLMDEVIAARLDKRTDPNYVRLGDSYFDRGKYLFKQKNTDQAIADMQAAADAYYKGKKFSNYAAALCQAAYYYNQRGAAGDDRLLSECYQKAFPYIEQGTVAYFNATAWLIDTYFKKGEDKKACKLVQKTTKKGKGENPLLYANFLSRISESEAKSGHYSEHYKDALAHAVEAVVIYRDEKDTISRNYAYLLKNAGDCHFTLQNFEKALTFYEQAEPLLLKHEGSGGKAYQGCVRQKSSTEVWLGKVDKVQDYLVKLEEIINTTSDTTNLSYADALYELAKGKAGIGLYNEAVSWGERALQRYESRGDTRQQVQMLYYLSGYYSHLEKHQRADELNATALKLCQKYPDYTKETANLLHQKSASLYRKGDYLQADEVCRQALLQLRKSNASETTAYAIMLCDRALFLYKVDSINAAISLTREALDLQSRILGPRHGNNVTLLFNLAIYHFRLGQTDSVAHYYHDAITLQTDLVRNNFSFQSPRQREHFWQRKSYLYKAAPLFASDPRKTSPDLLEDIYNAQLFTKGILLNSEIEFRRLLENTGDKDVLSKYDSLQLKRKELQSYKETAQGAKDDRTIIQLENSIRQLNWAIVRKCKEYGDFTQNLSLTSDSVRRSLRPNEAAIEFVETNVMLNGKPDRIYLALILRPEWKTPHVCQLFFRSKMEEMGYPAGMPVGQLLNDTVYQNRIYNDTQLGKLVWGNLLGELGGATHIYFAPSDMFYQWGIEYMPFTDEGKRISDTLKVSRLSSTKLLAQRSKKRPAFGDGEAIIFGGMDYNMMVSEMRRYKLGKEEVDDNFAMLEAEEQRQAEADLAAVELPDELRGVNSEAILEMTRQGEMAFQNLAGALKEAESIDHILRSAGIKTRRFGAYGTEGAFKALSGRKIALLHIATHGFSFPVAEQDRPEVDWLKPYATSSRPTDPLCYSGLVFAGCNWKTQYRKQIPADVPDGILTAQEIAQLNLQNLQLAVLSACQTGNGMLQEDGVFGVQRGFKKAGAHTLVMSLWSVNDAATQMMMTSFYENLLKGLSRQDAFLKAQQSVREVYPQPHFWAPFIMLDDI